MITLITNGAPTHEYGVKSLVGYLKANDVPVTAIYMNYCCNIHRRLKKQILDIVASSELAGFSLMTADVGLFQSTISDIRHKLKIPVVLGGIHATALPKESLAFSDYVCVGEGEEPLKQLYFAIRERAPLNAIPNIGYKEPDGNITVNRVKYFVNNLDELPYPDYKFETSYYYNHIRMQKITPEIRSNCFDSFYFYSQRGCKLACTYCSNSIYARLAKDVGAKWCRMTSANRVVDELKMYMPNFPSVKLLTFNDDDFLARDIGELEEISGFVKRELGIPFSVNGIPSFVTEEKVKLLVERGLRGIAFGVQSGSPRILNTIYKRPVTVESVINASNIIAKFREQNLNSDYGFILDNPYEEKDEWLETLNLIRALPKPRLISLYSLTFFPGTALINQAIQDKVIDQEQFHDQGKDYRSTISYSFKNTVIFLYSYFDVPHWLDSILLSKFMIKSRLALPMRFILTYPLGYFLRMSKKVHQGNRGRFWLAKVMRKNWVLRAIKYKAKHIYESRQRA